MMDSIACQMRGVKPEIDTRYRLKCATVEAAIQQDLINMAVISQFLSHPISHLLCILHSA